MHSGTFVLGQKPILALPALLPSLAPLAPLAQNIKTNLKNPCPLNGRISY